jgi:hypothetical protein
MANTFPGEAGPCPICGGIWDGGLIFDELRKMDYYKDKSDNELRASIKDGYGADDRHFYRVIGIEDPEVYDGVSWWRCPDCGSEWDRWTGKLTLTGVPKKAAGQ